ncbi:hypothetical protein KGM48_03280 [Patescibacteria group bacterium]|nr:hypothetical protein [Patescibacteria group bacterium]
MPPTSEDNLSSLERAKKRLYDPETPSVERSAPPSTQTGVMPGAWEKDPLKNVIAQLASSGAERGKRQVRAASLFFIGAFAFFLVSIGIAFFISYVGGNTISIDKVTVAVQGPTAIAGGDTVPLSVTVTNTNAVAIQNATIEIDFPNGTRSADNVLTPYPRYIENLGTLVSGASVSRSVKAVLFGGAGQALSIPVSVSYAASGSSQTFVKKSTYVTAISSSPLSVSVDTVAEAVPGQPITLTLTVRSNATVPLSNVVLNGAFPFGFTVQSSSLPLTNSSFLLGTLAPGATRIVSLTGTLTGQTGDERVFHFTIGTAATAQDQALAVAYMAQDAPISIAAPFISTTLTLNGDASPNPIIAPGSIQSLKVAYTNTLPTNVANATITVTISGTAIDYSTIQTQNGFYNSTNHAIVFSRDTDPSLASLAPGASGYGTISFSTLSASALPASPSITLTTSVSGTRIGQSNVPEQVTASVTKVAKVSTFTTVSAASLHSSGPLGTSGPIPPRVGQMTTYTVQWSVQAHSSAIAGGTMSTILPSYVAYVGPTSGSGDFSYDSKSRTVTWNIGDLAPSTSMAGAFQVSLVPSTSQKGMAPQLTGSASFTGYDRFAGTQITAIADPVTTETKNDPGYISTNAIVQ